MSAASHGPDSTPTPAADADTVADLVRSRLDRLRPAERKVARVLLADYPSVGLNTVAELANRASVSAPSVVRFAQSLGFEGFPALQAELRAELTRGTTGPLARARWQPEPGSHSELLTHRAGETMRLALGSLAAIPSTDMDATIDLLSDTSRRVFLAGGRFTGVVAEYLGLHLEQLRPKVRWLRDPAGADLGQVLDIRRRDVVVLFDVDRYQRSIIELAATARRRGATIVLFTDEHLSPAAADTDVVLPTTVESPSPFSSITAAFMLAELLAVLVMERIGEAAHARMAIFDNGRDHELMRP
ncbi:MurR/RpiR family transcriptional regulator [Streptomyces sp. NBC_00481]|uniref:MurR/RpiR family transcriptional regulator n=1 Tax=unclassified Streptomyces TaxID=2593676 RepID=UPI002DD9A5F0|nr:MULTISPECIES: MurR/RpiR family transcriptional regulator [unclassified Streptomyces]WRZ00425.1 MurR/RpiR family transcriptional regulator [Streptomyces sp. NBC_00481]